MSFPSVRMRRMRRSESLRRLVRETRLGRDDLVLPLFAVEGSGVREAVAEVKGPVVLIANLLTEGRGMADFSAAEAATWVSRALGRRVDVVIVNSGGPSSDALARYAAENKVPLPLGEIDPDIDVVTGRFWCSEIARHDRRRLAFAVWAVLSAILLRGSAPTSDARPSRVGSAV